MFTYVALAAWFLLRIAQFHDARTGFTALEVFGDGFAPQRITQIRELPLYTYRHSNGYDGQFYAQVAVAGNPFDPELRRALDAPAYRMRRILLPELAHLAGLGRPAWVLAAYALSNVVCWLILAWITARWWFPPTSFENLVRWGGTMFGAGVLVSATRSLTDGPSLLVLATGMRCLELNRRWLATAVLGIAGLVRETSVLAASAFVSSKLPTRSTVVRAILQAVLCILPAVLWIGILAAHYRTTSGNQTGVGVLTFFRECQTLYFTLRSRGLAAATDDACVVVALLVQLGFILGRPRPTMAWWRVGAAFALVPFLFGWAFWEDPLNGVPRTVLPLTLAFNVLAPRTRRGLALLLAGNLTVLSAPRVLDAAPSEQTVFADGIACAYAAGWYQPERAGRRTWRWASASAVLTVNNPQPGRLPVTIDFDIQSRTERNLTLYAGAVRQVVPLRALHGVHVQFGPLELAPGDTSLGFDTTEPSWTEPGPRGRTLSFSVQGLRITRVEAPR